MRLLMIACVFLLAACASVADTRPAEAGEGGEVDAATLRAAQQHGLLEKHLAYLEAVAGERASPRSG